MLRPEHGRKLVNHLEDVLRHLKREKPKPKAEKKQTKESKQREAKSFAITLRDELKAKSLYVPTEGYRCGWSPDDLRWEMRRWMPQEESAKRRLDGCKSFRTDGTKQGITRKLIEGIQWIFEDRIPNKPPAVKSGGTRSSVVRGITSRVEAYCLTDYGRDIGKLAPSKAHCGMQQYAKLSFMRSGGHEVLRASVRLKDGRDLTHQTRTDKSYDAAKEKVLGWLNEQATKHRLAEFKYTGLPPPPYSSAASSNPSTIAVPARKVTSSASSETSPENVSGVGVQMKELIDAFCRDKGYEEMPDSFDTASTAFVAAAQFRLVNLMNIWENPELAGHDNALQLLDLLDFQVNRLRNHEVDPSKPDEEFETRSRELVQRLASLAVDRMKAAMASPEAKQLTPTPNAPALEYV